MVLSLSHLEAPTTDPIVNKYAPKVEPQIIELCQELGIWQPHIAEYNTMSAYLFPYAGEQQLLAIGLYNNLLYFVDDSFDRHKQELDVDKSELMLIFNDAARVFATGDEPQIDTPVTRTVKYLHHLLKNIAPGEEWFQRFIKDTLEHLASSLNGIKSDMPEGTSSWFNYYNQIRDLDSGMSPTIDLVELALGYTIHNGIYHNELIKEAHLQVTRYCSLSNDLFSYDKEVVKYESDFNAVVMLQRDGHNLESAVDYLITRLNESSDFFRELYGLVRSDRLTDVMTDEALNYMDCLWYQIVAAYHWQYDTNRYRSPDSIFKELQTPVPESILIDND